VHCNQAANTNAHCTLFFVILFFEPPQSTSRVAIIMLLVQGPTENVQVSLETVSASQIAKALDGTREQFNVVVVTTVARQTRVAVTRGAIPEQSSIKYFFFNCVLTKPLLCSARGIPGCVGRRVARPFPNLRLGSSNRGHMGLVAFRRSGGKTFHSASSRIARKRTEPRTFETTTSQQASNDSPVTVSRCSGKQQR